MKHVASIVVQPALLLAILGVVSPATAQTCSGQADYAANSCTGTTVATTAETVASPSPIPVAFTSAELTLEEPAEPATSPQANSQSNQQSNLEIVVNNDGKETRISQNADGVTVAYPGDAGEKIEVKAKSVAELRKTSPAAYEVYKKYTGDKDPMRVVFGRTLERPEGSPLPPGFFQDGKADVRVFQFGEAPMTPPAAPGMARLRVLGRSMTDKAEEKAKAALEKAKVAMENAKELTAESKQKLAAALDEAKKSLDENAKDLSRLSNDLRNRVETLRMNPRPELLPENSVRPATPPAPPAAPAAPRVRATPAAPAFPDAPAVPAVPSSPRLGIIAGEVSEVLQAQIGKGVLVQDVMGDSKAAGLGLKKHDLIRSINGHPVEDIETLRSAMQDAGETLTAEITRGGKPMTLSSK